MNHSEKFSIAGLGEILWDIYDDKKFLGGAPANFALHVQRLGYEGLVLSRVGDDRDGYEILDNLKERSINISGIQIDPKKPTGTVIIKLNEKGVPKFKCSTDVAFDYFDDFSKQIAKSKKIDAILFGTLAQRNNISRNAVQTFLQRKPAGIVIFDANLRGIDEKTKNIVRFSLQNANVLKMNDDEAELLPKILQIDFNNKKEFYSYLLEQYQLDLICITLGEFGALAITKDKMVYSPGFQISVVDTTGSGDAFIAAFVSSYLAKKSLSECLEFANALGALVATKQGAVPDYGVEEIDALIINSTNRIIDEKYKNPL